MQITPILIFSNCTKCCGGGGGFIQPIPGDGVTDQLCRVSVIEQLPTDKTRGPEQRGNGRIWPDAYGPVQDSQHEMRKVL